MVKKRSADDTKRPTRSQKPDITIPLRQELQETAAHNTLAIHPLIGIRISDFGEAAQTLVQSVVTEPLKAARHFGGYVKAVGRAVMGRSALEIDPKDKRFMDPAWQGNAALRRVLQAHATTAAEFSRYIEATSLSTRDKARAQLIVSILVDTIAPSNTLLNPTALKRAIDTGGASLVRGAKNLVHDLRHNKGLPSSVDKSGFALGRNLALRRASR